MDTPGSALAFLDRVGEFAPAPVPADAAPSLIQLVLLGARPSVPADEEDA